MYTRVFTTLLALAASVNTHPTRLQPRSASHQIGYISVDVATLWTNPHKPRPVDAPALTNPANPEEWLHDMTVKQYLNLTTQDRTQSQALYGDLVYILDAKDGWYHIAATGQPTPKNKLGYPGWVPAAQVSLDTGFGALQSSMPFALVDNGTSVNIYRDAAMSDVFMTISYDTRLPVIGQTSDAIQVAVPSGGSAYISTSDASVYSSDSDIPYPTGETLVQAAQRFIGLPYLWGGTSGYSVDCAGLTHTIYHANGILIGRDASAQADSNYTGHGVQGTSVARADLQPGDIIFYATNLSDPQTVYHDAMYAGNGQMIEAYGAGIPVRITAVRYNSDYWGAERFLTG